MEPSQEFDMSKIGKRMSGKWRIGERGRLEHDASNHSQIPSTSYRALILLKSNELSQMRSRRRFSLMDYQGLVLCPFRMGKRVHIRLKDDSKARS